MRAQRHVRSCNTGPTCGVQMRRNYSVVQFVAGNICRVWFLSSIRMHSPPLLTSLKRYGASITRPWGLGFPIVRGGFRSMVKMLLWVSASSANVTSVCIAALTVFCSAARLVSSGFTILAGLSPASVWHPTPVITTKVTRAPRTVTAIGA